MPLLLRALPLSLQTFWRYLILLPFLVIAAFVLSLVGGVIPFVNYLVPGAVGAYCTIMGIRCALAARGNYDTPGFKQLLVASFGFALLHIVAKNISVLVVWGLTALMHVFGMPIHEQDALLSFGVIASLYLILLSIYASVIAVPMTEAAYVPPRGTKKNGFFFGMGTGAFSLFIIMLIWGAGGNFLAFFGTVKAIFLMVILAFLAAWRGDDIPWHWDFSPIYLISGTLFMAWASCWFFATAVLAWEKAGRRQKQARTTEIEAQRVSADDLRSLRKLRQKR